MALRVLPGGDAPPHSLEAERQVIGTVLVKPELLPQIELSTEEFYGEGHARIWGAIQYLAAEGIELDELHVRERLIERGQLESIGGDDYLLSLTDTIPSVAPADIVRKLAQQRGVQEIGKRLARAAQAGDLVEAQTAVREAARALEDAERRPVVEWWSANSVFAPLPPVSWRVRGLQICPGRPSMIAGYGASAKTLSAQSLALCAAVGYAVWGHFECAPMQVRHLDYEQGRHATFARYQRLAIGHGIDPREAADRLKVAVFPRLYLDQPGAEEAYARVVDGAELVILDSMRGAAPAVDENDSRIGEMLQTLTRVSERTGAAFLLIHHAGKPQPGHADERTVLRGSSAIFAALGSVYVITGKSADEPRAVKHAKPPAEAAGKPVQDFLLDVQDVHQGYLNAGVRVVHRHVAEPDPAAEASAKFDARCSQLLRTIREHPGMSKAELVGRAGMSSNAVYAMLETLASAHAVRLDPGPRGAVLIYPANSQARPERPDG